MRRPELEHIIRGRLPPGTIPSGPTEIDGSLGDGSYFDAAFGYYAHAVGPETAKAPAGWEERLVPIRNENTGGATGWCLEIHDLLLSKCAAGRDRDWTFAKEALRHGLADPDELHRRASGLPLAPADVERIQRMLAGDHLAFALRGHGRASAAAR